MLLDVQPRQSEYEVQPGDVRRMEDVRTAAEGGEIIIHTAAIPGIRVATQPRRDFYDFNLKGTRNVREVAVKGA